jgi:hypothetical protein
VTKLIGISGKKQSGKDTTNNIIQGIVLKRLGKIRDWRVTDLGKLSIFTSDANGVFGWGEFDVSRRDPEFLHYAEKQLFPYIKSYSMAEGLKEICVDFLGLKPEQVYGDNNAKNSETHLKWENMPGVVTNELLFESIYDKCLGPKMPDDHQDENFLLTYHEPGNMTAREVLQFFGTDIMRRMYNGVWVNHTMNRIEREKSEIAIVTDVRFPDEGDAIHNRGGLLLRLGRDIESSKHSSEAAMDDYDISKYVDVFTNHGSIQDLVNYVGDFVNIYLPSTESVAV